MNELIVSNEGSGWSWGGGLSRAWHIVQGRAIPAISRVETCRLHAAQITFILYNSQMFDYRMRAQFSLLFHYTDHRCITLVAMSSGVIASFPQVAMQVRVSNGGGAKGKVQ